MGLERAAEYLRQPDQVYCMSDEVMGDSAKFYSLDERRTSETTIFGSAQTLVAPIEALTDPRLSDTQRRVLLVLYSFRNKSTGTAFPSLQTLAERSLIKDHTRISKITSALSKMGWLTKKKKGFTGGNEYRLHVPDCILQGEIKNTNLDDSANLVENTKSNLAKSTNSNLAKYAKCKEQSIEQLKEHKKDIVGQPDCAPVCQRVIDHLNQKTGKAFRNVKSHQKFINARLKEGYSEADLITVIDRKATEWLNDPRMHEYLRPSTLFNSEKFDGYLNATTAPRFSPPTRTSAPRHFSAAADYSGMEGFDNV